LDLVIREALDVAASDAADGGAWLFYDRNMGISSFGSTAGTTEVSSDSSGTPAVSSDDGNRDQIFIDAVWAVDFEKCPEVVRTFVAMLSARQFAQRVVGDPEAAGFTEMDLAAAWRALEDDQGEPENLNLMDSMDVYRGLGGRPRGGLSGGRDIRYV
jgi:hypothetical protein